MATIRSSKKNIPDGADNALEIAESLVNGKMKSLRTKKFF